MQKGNEGVKQGQAASGRGKLRQGMPPLSTLRSEGFRLGIEGFRQGIGGQAGTGSRQVRETEAVGAPTQHLQVWEVQEGKGGPGTQGKLRQHCPCSHCWKNSSP